MLHSRRKAEIEILSSTSQPVSQINDPQHSVHTTFEDGDRIIKYPLVQYLIPKLDFWVDLILYKPQELSSSL